MTTILDRNGAPIEVGARVIENGETVGTVIELTDPDGDVNCYGRQVAVGPYVVVQYAIEQDDGTTEYCRERWTASWNATGPWDDHRTDYSCDDVEIVPRLSDAWSKP